MTTEREMPKYRSHKEVWALKVKKVMCDREETAGTIFPEDEGYGPVPVTGEYLRKHNPQAGGYYVVYPDGYKSWSPAEAFESGYSRI